MAPLLRAADLVSEVASSSVMVFDDLFVVWYMDVLRASDGGAGGRCGRVVPGAAGLVPGARDCRPRGVSRMTRKWPVNGGPSAEGRVSGSTYTFHAYGLSHQGITTFEVN